MTLFARSRELHNRVLNPVREKLLLSERKEHRQYRQISKIIAEIIMSRQIFAIFHTFQAPLPKIADEMLTSGECSLGNLLKAAELSLLYLLKCVLFLRFQALLHHS